MSRKPQSPLGPLPVWPDEFPIETEQRDRGQPRRLGDPGGSASMTTRFRAPLGQWDTTVISQALLAPPDTVSSTARVGAAGAEGAQRRQDRGDHRERGQRQCPGVEPWAPRHGAIGREGNSTSASEHNSAPNGRALRLRVSETSCGVKA